MTWAVTLQLSYNQILDSLDCSVGHCQGMVHTALDGIGDCSWLGELL